MGAPRTRPLAGPLTVLLLVAAALQGSVAAGAAPPTVLGDPEGLPAAEPAVRVDPEADVGADGALRRALHRGTHPVSPPPGAAPLVAADRAVTVAPGGGPIAPPGTSGFAAATPPRDPAPHAPYTVRGAFRYEDRGLDHTGFTGATWMSPVRRADVEVFDVNSGEVLGSGSTDDAGTFAIPVDDGTVRDLAVRALTTSRGDPSLFNASVAALPSLGGAPYALTSPVYAGHPPGTDIDFRSAPVNATKEGVGGPFHMFDLAESAERYVQNLTGTAASVDLTIHWSAGYNPGKYYDLGGRVFLPGTAQDDDSYDDPIVLHEIGHYIAITYSSDAGFYGPHGLAGVYDIRLSYTEGLGSYFMGAVRNFLNVPQPLLYVETDGDALLWFGFSLSYDTDTPSSYSDGAFQDWTSANEVAVGHALYDVVDGVGAADGTPGADDDPFDLPPLVGDRLVWDVLVSIRENRTLFPKAITMETFYDQWLLVHPAYGADFLQVLRAHGIEYEPDAFEADDAFPQATPVPADGSLRHHTFFPAGDEDWSSFPAVAGGQYVVRTQDLLDGADTVLELYDADGTTLLATNDDRDAGTRASLVTVLAPAAQAYYVRAYRAAEAPTPIGEYGKYNVTVYLLPRPEVASVAPPSGPVAGGTAVTLTGANFSVGAEVLFGVYAAASAVVVGPGTITATTPANVPGPVDVTVRNPRNADGIVPEGMLAAGYVYTGSAIPPIVRRITPDFGTSSVATRATVEGDYFVAGATLQLDAVPCASFTVVDPRTIVATIQPLPVGVYDVLVTNPNGLWDRLANAYESASYAWVAVGSDFDSASPLSASLPVTDDFEVMDLYVWANVTHPPNDWGGVRLELESPAGTVARVFDRILVADGTGTAWRTRIAATFGHDEAPSEVLSRFRGERTAGTWTLHATSVLDGGVPSTLHDWALYLFRHRHRDVAGVVLTAAYFRNYVTAFEEGTGTQLYRVRLEARDPLYSAPFPITVAVARDRRHACGGGFSDYNVTRGGWTDSAVTCFEATTGRIVRTFSFSGNLHVDGLEAARDADRIVVATNEFVYRMDAAALLIDGSVPTGFPANVEPPRLGVTPDGRKAYVASLEGQHVLVVDLDAMALAGRIDVPGYAPLDVDLSWDGSFGVVSSWGSPSVLHRFDPATDAIVDARPVAGLRAFQTALTPDGSKAFYSIYQWYAGFGRTHLGTGDAAVSLPHPESTTEGIAMGRDGTLYVPDWYLQRVWVVDSASEAVLREIAVPDRVFPAGIDLGEVVGKVALNATAGNGWVDLRWGAPPSPGSPVQEYRVYRGTSPGEQVWLATVGATGHVDASVANGVTYYYRVSAVNAAGEGAWSDEVAATPGAWPPEIFGVSAAPDPQRIGGVVNITCVVTGGPPVSEVRVNVTAPGGGTTNASMARVGATDAYYYEAAYGTAGAHAFVVLAANVDGDWNASAPASFTIVADALPPEILEVRASPDPQAVGGPVALTARVVDDVGVSGVWVVVTFPGGGSANASMSPTGGDAYGRTDPYALPGTHGFTVWAVDASGNVNASSGSFVIVDVRAPAISGVSATPDPQDAGGIVNLTATVTDDVAVAGVWALVTAPGGGTTNASMSRVGATDAYYVAAPYGALGVHAYRVGAVDAAGNANASAAYAFATVDRIAPVVTEVRASPDPQEVGGAVNLTARVADNVGVSGVWVVVTFPGGGTTNASMSRVPGTDTYFREAAYGTLGAHAFRLWALDGSGNVATASGTFLVADTRKPEIRNVRADPPVQEIYGRVNVSVEVADNHGLDGPVWIRIVGPSGAEANRTMRRGAGDAWYLDDAYAAVGTYAFEIWARDLAGNGNGTASSFELRDTTPPVAVAGGDRTAVTGQSVPFDGSGSTDNSGTVANHTWRVARGGTTIAVLHGASVSFAFPEAGTYVVTLSVTDPSGNAGEDAATVLVRDPEGPGDGEPGAPFPLWVLLLPAAVAIALLLLLWFRRRRTAPAGPEPAREATDAAAGPRGAEPDEAE